MTRGRLFGEVCSAAGDVGLQESSVSHAHCQDQPDNEVDGMRREVAGGSERSGFPGGSGSLGQASGTPAGGIPRRARAAGRDRETWGGKAMSRVDLREVTPGERSTEANVLATEARLRELESQ